jgi:hypothetical protein
MDLRVVKILQLLLQNVHSVMTSRGRCHFEQGFFNEVKRKV